MHALDLIEAERLRQIDDEGWTAEHDAEHASFELVRAAVCYANAGWQGLVGQYAADSIPHGWPWTGDWWKPSDDPVRNLVKAAALIAAEIDRLQAEVV